MIIHLRAQVQTDIPASLRKLEKRNTRGVGKPSDGWLTKACVCLWSDLVWSIVSHWVIGGYVETQQPPTSH